jgi:hypothetical protein
MIEPTGLPAIDAQPLAPPVGRRELSKVPKVCGVLSIVFASFVLVPALPMSCGSLAGAGMSDMVARSWIGGEFDGSVDLLVDALSTIYLGLGLINLMLLVLSGVLIGIGVGQLRYRVWAIKGSVYWGVAGIISVGLTVLLMVFSIGPAYADMFAVMAMGEAELAEMAPAFGSTVGRLMGVGGAVLHTVLMLPYPLLMVVLFKRRRVRESMDETARLSDRAAQFD